MKTICMYLFLLLALCSMLHGQQGYSSAAFAMSKERAGRLAIPLPEEVVVEEYINYHRHQLKMGARMDRAALDIRWAKSVPLPDGEQLLQVGISTHVMTALWRPRANLCFVVDRSGSMSGEKMQKTKEALQVFAEKLGPKDVVSLVAFDHMVEVPFAAGEVGNGQRLYEAIRKLQARGSTNLNAGITAGYQQLLAHFDPRGTNRLIILTDALLNTGELDPYRIIRNSQYYDADRHIDFSFVGVGMDFNHQLARVLTKSGGNSVHFIHDANDIAKVFDKEAASLLTQIGRNPVLEISYGPGLELVHCYGYQPAHLPAFAEEGVRGSLRFTLPNINAGLTQVFLLRFRKAPGHNRHKYGLNSEQVSAHLDYLSVAEGKAVHVGKNGGKYPGYASSWEQAYQKDIAKNLCIAELAMSLKAMAQAYQQGHASKAVAIVHDALSAADATGWPKRDKDVARIYEILARYRKDLDRLISERGGEAYGN